MKSVTMSETQLEQSVLEGLWELECPYCRSTVQAEPDAQTTCCQDCNQHIAIINPYF